MFDDKCLKVGRYKGHKVYYNGIMYYVKIKGKIFAIDYDKH